MTRQFTSLVTCVVVTLLLLGCTTFKPALKTEEDFNHLLTETAVHKDSTLDFLANEKLPNEVFEVPEQDSTEEVENSVEKQPIYKEVRPQDNVRFRVQVFAGSAENAKKNFDKLVTELELDNTFLIQDQASGLWKVWQGAYSTRQSAVAGKESLIASGFVDAWILELKETEASAATLYWVQIGSFQNEQSAKRSQEDILNQLNDKVEIHEVEGIWKVRVGGFNNQQDAAKLRQRIEELDYKGAFIVKITSR